MLCRLARAVAFALAVSLIGARAEAGREGVILLPTVSPIGPLTEQGRRLERPSLERSPMLTRWAGHLDTILSEAVQDLGLTLDLSERQRPISGDLTELSLVERAADAWVVSPRLALIDGQLLHLRLVVVAPGSEVVLVNARDVEAREFEVRSLLMLRELVKTGRGQSRTVAAEVEPPVPDQGAVVHRTRSEGRAILALSGAALGGYIGFSLQRAGGSEDARLTYPLLALGAGVGLGGSMIIADEWDIGIGEAWYLTAGAVWPLASGLLIADSYDVDEDSQHMYGLVGATAGLTLATLSVALSDINQGGAVLAHSGGAFGLLLGGVAELIHEGRTDVTPTRGMGIGSAVGVIAGGALATQWKPPASRMLLIDLSASLGALTGAAAASPLLFIESEPEPWQNRVWLASIAGGTAVGGFVGLWLTRRTPDEGAMRSPMVLPNVGIIGFEQHRDVLKPVFGAGLGGSW